MSGNIDGGAARGTLWLHEGLLECDIDSHIMTNSKKIIFDKRIKSTLRSKQDYLLNALRYKLDRSFSLFYYKRERKLFSTGFFGTDFMSTNIYKQADIIHLHWINKGFNNIKDFSKINKPIIWTLRDMWPFTGGCHYTINCKKYIIGCGKCDQLNSEFQYDLSWYIFNRKKKYFPMKMKIVGISKWLSTVAKESKIFRNNDIRTIPNNIDTKIFFPTKKIEAKSILGIKTRKKII